MTGLRFEILDRYKELELMFADRGDFTLGEGRPFDAREILTNPRCTLYSLDVERREAIFVETPADVDLGAAPFYFIEQYRKATFLVSVSFDTFHELAEELVFDEKRLALVYSVGRCGSTLVSKAFEAVPRVCSLSEPDTLTLLVCFRGSGRMEDAELQLFARDCIRFACKPLAFSEDCDFWAIKFRSQCLEICDLLDRSFPKATNLYLTRDPVSWIESAYRAFVDPESVDDEGTKQFLEDVFAGMYGLIREVRIPGKPMPVWKVWLYNWIANVETRLRLGESGVAFCEASFAEIKRDPEAVMRRLFDACCIELEDWTPVHAALVRDSQEGSGIAQSLINDAARRLPDRNREEAIELLIERGHLRRGSKP